MKIVMTCRGVTEREAGDTVIYDARLSRKPSNGDGLPDPHGEVTLQNVREATFKAGKDYVVEITPVSS